RHTEDGSIVVVVRAVGGRVRLEVVDTGEGIPPEDLPFVFERFYRADSARSRDTGGSGIGLAIARQIVEDHGGTVSASSREGGGAVVGFELPGLPG
ncbi:MAG: HAMP domain-containing sensor histidine kinase, partial [Actinomycetes bacterium]